MRPRFDGGVILGILIAIIVTLIMAANARRHTQENIYTTMEVNENAYQSIY